VLVLVLVRVPQVRVPQVRMLRALVPLPLKLWALTLLLLKLPGSPLLKH
jgi:hypothetical protein